MKYLIKTVFVIALVLLSFKMSAQLEVATRPKYGIEIELVQPFIPDVNIYRVVGTIRLTSAEAKNEGDLLVGLYIRPNVKHDIVEKINEYLLITGYRQYFWKGLHAEARSNLGYAWGTKNLIDGKDYNNFSWFWEVNAGYKLDFAKKQNSNFYAILQGGILSSITSNIGPRGGKADTFPQGNLLIGINF